MSIKWQYRGQKNNHIRVHLSYSKSNVQTNTVASFADHPIRTFLEQGILVCLNSDDPAVSGIELAHEYQVAAPQAGLNAQQMRTLQENGLTLSYLSESEKTELKAKKLSKVPD